MKRVLAIALVALAVVSCSAAPAAKPAAPQNTFGLTGGSGMTADSAAPSVPPAPAATAVAKSRQATESTSVPELATSDRMIVYTVQLNVEVQDTEKAEAAISTIVAQYKGYISGTQMSRNSKGRLAGTISLRIPAESLDAAQKAIEGVGLRVLSRNRSSSDVTDQYTDLDARLTNLQATEIELRQLLETVREKTGKADDILAVYNRLTEIRGQIEQIKGKMNVLSQTSTYATVTVVLTPHEEVVIVEEQGWLPGQIARQALRALVQVLQALGTLAIWLVIVGIPVLIIIALPFVILGWILRAILRRQKKRKPAPS